MTSKPPPLIHYGLAPFKISTAPFKMLMRHFWVPRIYYLLLGGGLLIAGRDYFTYFWGVWVGLK